MVACANRRVELVPFSLIFSKHFAFGVVTDDPFVDEASNVQTFGPKLSHRERQPVVQ